MNPVLQIALSNAAIVIAMAALVYLITRLVPRSSIAHALWVLVLVKLVTPPLVEIPFTIAVETPDQRTEFRSATNGGFDVEADTTIAGVPQRGRESRHAVNRRAVIRNGEVTTSTAAPSTTPASAHARSWTAELSAWLGRLRSASESSVASVLFAIWGVGTGLWFSAALIRFILFRRMLKRLTYRIAAAEARCGTLAARLGCRVTPQLLFVERPISPMLWGCGRRATLVFPAALWKSIDGTARDTLLLHELAHFHRGDHWVRLLELVVTGLFWWHPVVWLALREIGTTEEECCDALVIGELDGSPRPYAEAILSTLDFIAEYRPLSIPVVSGISNVPLLKHRLRQIMERSVQPSMSARSRWMLIVAAVLIVPLHPILNILPVSPLDAAMSSSRTASELSADNLNTVRPPQTAVVNMKALSSATETVDDGARAGWWNQRPNEHWASVTSRDVRHRLTASIGHRVTLSDLNRGHTVDLSDAHFTVASFTSGNRFVAGSLDGSVRLYDLETGEPVSPIGQHQDRVTALSTTADGRQIVSGSRDGTVILWDAASGSALATWTQPTLPVTAVRISADGASIAVAAGDWKIDQASQLTLFSMKSSTFEHSGSWVTDESAAAVEFLSDRLILTAGWNGKVEVRDLNGTLQRTASVDRNAVASAAFSSNYKLASRLPPARTGSGAAPASADSGDR